jgi:hypothetical protein
VGCWVLKAHSDSLSAISAFEGIECSFSELVYVSVLRYCTALLNAVFFVCFQFLCCYNTIKFVFDISRRQLNAFIGNFPLETSEVRLSVGCEFAF